MCEFQLVGSTQVASLLKITSYIYIYIILLNTVPFVEFTRMRAGIHTYINSYICMYKCGYLFNNMSAYACAHAVQLTVHINHDFGQAAAR